MNSEDRKIMNKVADKLGDIDTKVVRIEEHMNGMNGTLKWCVRETNDNSMFINNLKGALKLASFAITAALAAAAIYVYGAV